MNLEFLCDKFQASVGIIVLLIQTIGPEESISGVPYLDNINISTTVKIIVFCETSECLIFIILGMYVLEYLTVSYKHTQLFGFN